MASLLIAALVFLAAALIAAVVGAVLAPRQSHADRITPPTAPWAATRCAHESLENLRSPAPPRRDAVAVPGRMYAMAPPSADRVSWYRRRHFIGGGIR